RVYMRAKHTVESGDADAMERAGLYLESHNLNETILLPDLHIDHVCIFVKLMMPGNNVLFTDIDNMKGEDIIDLYRKRNRVEHCFRSINTMDPAFPLYHWTPHKISVHMFMSLLSYLFLSLIYNRMHRSDSTMAIVSMAKNMKDIMVVYAARGKTVRSRLDFKSETGKTIGRVMKPDELITM
ncbi:MAG: transposase, partial [Thermoplasmatales archaeon]